MLNVGDEERQIENGCGVKQGENLVPTLFVFGLKLVTEEKITALKECNIKINNYKNDEFNGKINLLSTKDITFVSTEEKNLSARMDNGSFALEDISD